MSHHTMHFGYGFVIFEFKISNFPHVMESVWVELYRMAYTSKQLYVLATNTYGVTSSFQILKLMPSTQVSEQPHICMYMFVHPAYGIPQLFSLQLRHISHQW